MRYYNFEDKASDMRLTIVHFDLACIMQTGSFPAGYSLSDFNAISVLFNQILHTGEAKTYLKAPAEYFAKRLFNVVLEADGINYRINLLNNYRLYIMNYNNCADEAFCISNCEYEGYIDEDIYTSLGITEEQFYEACKDTGAEYFHHTFTYGAGDTKEVCDTYFRTRAGAEDFLAHLLDSIMKTKEVK